MAEKRLITIWIAGLSQGLALIILEPEKTIIKRV
jgi:hypothetical protein